MKRITLSLVAQACLAASAFAGEGAEECTGQQLLESLLPIVLIFMIVWFLVRRVGKRNEPYMERAKVHMDRLEEQNREMISLLRELTGKTGQSEQSSEED